MDNLLPGYRFYPTEEELITFYLRNQIEGKRPVINQVIPVVSVYDIEPWHLPELAGQLCQGDKEQWFYFVPRQEREARGGRPNRTTAAGYWKATGSPGFVYSSDNKVIGLKKSMVFYKGKAPTGRKTKWKMNEYRAIEEASSSSTTSFPKLRTEFALCRVYVVSGSCRAFDRRPLEVAPQQAAQGGGEATGRGGQVDIPENSGNSSWEMTSNMEQSLWDLEQLNWP